MQRPYADSAMAYKNILISGPTNRGSIYQLAAFVQ